MASLPLCRTLSTMYSLINHHHRTINPYIMNTRPLFSRYRHCNSSAQSTEKGNTFAIDKFVNAADCRLWLIVMEFPPDSEPSAQQLGQVYVRTCAKGLDICTEKAQHKINAWSMTTYGGFQLQMTKEESYKFKGLPGVILIHPILAKGGQAGKGPGQAKSNFMERYHEIITNARFVSNLAIIMFIFGLITIGELLETTKDGNEETKDGNEVNKDDQRQMMLMEEEIHREVRGLVKDLKSLEPEVKEAISQELKSSVEGICDKLKDSLDQVKKEIVDEIVDEVKSSREDVKNSIQSKK